MVTFFFLPIFTVNNLREETDPSNLAQCLLHPIKRQPFLQWHGELIRKASPVVLSHLVLKSLKDLKLNTTRAASENRT